MNKNEVKVLNELEKFASSITNESIRTELFFRQYQELKNLQSYINEYVKRVDGAVQKIIDENYLNIPDGKLETMYGKVTRVFDKCDEKEIFDMVKFQEENPTIYKNYLKKEYKETKGYTKITPSKFIKEQLGEVKNGNLQETPNR